MARSLKLLLLIFFFSFKCIGKNFSDTLNINNVVESKLVHRKDTFEKKIDVRAVFHSQVDFTKSVFKSDAWFNFCQFDSSLRLPFGVFESDFVLSNNVLSGPTSFAFCQFNGHSEFFNNSFGSNIDFTAARFAKSVDLGFSKIHGLLNFTNATFNSNLRLNNLTLTGNAQLNFKYSSLPDTIDLSYNEDWGGEKNTVVDFGLCDYSEQADTQKTNLWGEAKAFAIWYFKPKLWAKSQRHGKIHFINLYNTDISKVKIDYLHFRLYFEQERQQQLFDEFGNNIGFMKTSDVSLSNDAILAVYEQLLKNFKDRGQLESYKYLDIEYQRYLRRDWIIDVEDIWWCYGYEKQRIFVHSLLILLLFSLINMLGIHKLNDKEKSPYFLSFIPQELISKNNDTLIAALPKRFWASIVYTFVVFCQPTLKLDNIRPERKLPLLWILIMYSIGLFCLGYIANFILQK